MATLLHSAGMSLDGFIAGPGGDMSWLADASHEGSDAGFDGEIDALVGDVGALLGGRRTFDGDDPNAGTEAEGAFGGRWTGTQVVLTHDRDRTTSAPGVVFRHDLVSAVETARAVAGERYVHVLGADVARQCLEAGLLDEILVFVAPVLLGDGVPLFRVPGGRRVPLGRRARGREGMWFRVGPSD